MSKKMTILLIIIALILITAGVWYFTQKNRSEIVSNSFKTTESYYKPWSEFKPIDANSQNALLVIGKELETGGENPKDFYVEMESVYNSSANTLIFHLIYKSDFEMKSVTLGNPSRESRDIFYDVDLKKITKTTFWQ